LAEPVALATVEQLQRWTQWEFEEDSPEFAQAEDVLLMASEWARSIAGKLWATAESTPKTVVGIVLAAARREIENPRRATYEVKGPESASYNQQNYPAGLFTEPEYRFLRRFRKSGALWSLSSYRDLKDDQIGYLYAGTGSEPLPMYWPGDPGWEESAHL
jgi:hypothetical protein